jgi:hypothetical protein
MQLNVMPKEYVVKEDSAACTTFDIRFQYTNDHRSPSCIQGPCKAPCYRLAHKVLQRSDASNIE